MIHDRQPALAASLQRDGAEAAASIAELTSRMTRPRAIWLMVPAGAVDEAIADLAPRLESGAPAAARIRATSDPLAMRINTGGLLFASLST